MPNTTRSGPTRRCGDDVRRRAATRPSPRPLPTRPAADSNIPAHCEVRRVSPFGQISWQRAVAATSPKCSAAPTSAFEEVDDGIWMLYFATTAARPLRCAYAHADRADSSHRAETDACGSCRSYGRTERVHKLLGKRTERVFHSSHTPHRSVTHVFGLMCYPCVRLSGLPTLDSRLPTLDSRLPTVDCPWLTSPRPIPFKRKSLRSRPISPRPGRRARRRRSATSTSAQEQRRRLLDAAHRHRATRSEEEHRPLCQRAEAGDRSALDAVSGDRRDDGSAARRRRRHAARTPAHAWATGIR